MTRTSVVWPRTPWQPKEVDDKASVFPMLSMLPDMAGACATVTRNAICKLLLRRWVLPPEEMSPE